MPSKAQKQPVETTLTGYDTVASSVGEWHAAVPVSEPQVIGSYRNGRYANDTAAKQAFPKAFHFDYDVNASDPAADDLDVEPGDATPSQAPGWARSWLTIGVAKHNLPKPAIYESASSISAVVTAMLDAGFKREDFLIDSAHFNFKAHICGPNGCGFPQADKTQYADKGPQGQNVDISLVAQHFIKAVKPVYDPHYDWFDTKKRLIFGRGTEADKVKAYDEARKNPHSHRARLRVLRLQLKAGSARLSKMLEMDKEHKFHRYWRKRELKERSQGHRFV